MMKGSWNKRLFAWMIDAESDSARKIYEVRKRSLLGQLHGTVLEIGPGTGANLIYYAPDVQWIGIEPNPAMFPYLEREAKRLGLTIQLREGSALAVFRRVRADQQLVLCHRL